MRAGADLSAVAEAFKRVANILRDQKDIAETVDAAAFGTEAERMLWEATSMVEVNVQVATKRGAFDEAFSEIARLRLPLDRFFKDVMVMDPDPRVRQNRVALRAKLQRIFAPLAEAFVNLIGSGGKRLRPALALLASEFNGSLQGTAQYNCVIALAASVEMLHTATLVHDDLIDGSLMRRGAATLNAAWTPAATVLTLSLIHISEPTRPY